MWISSCLFIFNYFRLRTNDVACTVHHWTERCGLWKVVKIKPFASTFPSTTLYVGSNSYVTYNPYSFSLVRFLLLLYRSSAVLIISYSVRTFCLLRNHISLAFQILFLYNPMFWRHKSSHSAQKRIANLFVSPTGNCLANLFQKLSFSKQLFLQQHLRRFNSKSLNFPEIETI